jgi:hypothetical protein
VNIASPITVTLGDQGGDGQIIQVVFDADAPGTPGSADFTATVDDTATTTVSAQAATEGDGNNDGGADGDDWTVTVQGNAVTSAVAEIAPNAVAVGSTGNSFTYDIRPTVNAGDTGVNQVVITAPAGYTNFNVTAVSLDGTGKSASGSCPSPAAGEYCVTL